MSKRYKGVATLVWDFETAATFLDAQKHALEYLEKILGEHIPKEITDTWKITVRSHPVAIKEPKKIILAEMTVDEVLDYIDQSERDYVIDGTIHKIKMTSLRYQTFKRDKCTCVCCGLIGTKMVLEKHRNTHRPHFNLYGIEDGREVLFTKDHIIPVAHDGDEALDNLQTMCTICNLLKGSAKELSMESLRKMRQVYQENVKQGNIITAIKLKQMKLGIAEQEEYGRRRGVQLNKIMAGAKAKAGKLRFIEDVQVWKVPEGGYVGLPVTMKKKLPAKAVKVEGTVFVKNSIVKPLRARSDKIHVVFDSEGKYCRIAQALLDYVNEGTKNAEKERPETDAEASNGEG